MIPKRVFTYWEGVWGADEERCWNSVKEIFDGWDIQIITPENLPDNLDAGFFHSIPLLSQRANYLRYFELFERGGFWLDADVVALRSFEPLRQYSLVAGWEDDYFVNNAIIGAHEKHPVFLYCMAKFPHATRYGRSATAPLLFTEALGYCGLLTGEENSLILPEEGFYPQHWSLGEKAVDFKSLTPENFPHSYCVHRWKWMWDRYETGLPPQVSVQAAKYEEKETYVNK